MSSRSLPLPFTTAWPWVAFVALIFLANYGARATLSPLLVALETDMHINHSQATSLLMLQGFGFSVALGLSGFLMSSVRPAHIAVFSLVAAGMSLLFMPLVNTLLQGQVLFLIFGLMAGLYFPAGMATLSSLVFPQDLGKAVGIHELAPNTGFIIMPLLMQLALHYTDWRGAFSFVGLGMISIGLSFLLFGRGGQQCTQVASFAGSARVLRDSRTWLFAILLTICLVGEFTIYSVMQLYLVSEQGFSAEKANLILSLSRAITPLAVVGAGFAADRYNPARVLGLCLLLHGVALGMMNLSHIYLALGGVFAQAFCIAFSFPALFKIMGDCIKVNDQPLLLSFTMPLAGLVATGFVPWLLGLCGEYASFGLGFIVLGGGSILSILALIPLQRVYTKTETKSR
ncbi:MAG: MFS transporter [Desulfovibrionaceae bacterium]